MSRIAMEWGEAERKSWIPRAMGSEHLNRWIVTTQNDPTIRSHPWKIDFIVILAIRSVSFELVHSVNFPQCQERASHCHSRLSFMFLPQQGTIKGLRAMGNRWQRLSDHHIEILAHWASKIRRNSRTECHLLTPSSFPMRTYQME
jgi:hypothetical protein